MAGNDVQFSLEQIQQLNVKQLQAFLRERGLKTVGRKAELQALAFSAVQLGYKVKQTEVEEDRLRSDQYAELLNIEGKRIPDPLVEINNWISEKEGVRFWPPVSYFEIAEWLLNDAPSYQRTELK